MTEKETVFITPTGIITCVLLHLCLGAGARLLFHTVFEGFFFVCFLDVKRKKKKFCSSAILFGKFFMVMYKIITIQFLWLCRKLLCLLLKTQLMQMTVWLTTKTTDRQLFVFFAVVWNGRDKN